MLKQIFEEVSTDHIDNDTGERAIDGYFPNSEEGCVVAWIRRDGTFRLGDHAKPEYLFCRLIQETLRDLIVEIVLKAKG